MAAVEKGLEDAEAGRVHSHEMVVAEMKARFQKREPR
jgi:predicted transcriptional regulator